MVRLRPVLKTNWVNENYPDSSLRENFNLFQPPVPVDDATEMAVNEKNIQLPRRNYEKFPPIILYVHKQFM